MGLIGRPIPVFRNAVLAGIAELGKAEFPTQPNREFSWRNREAIREFHEGTENSCRGAEVPVASVVIPMRLAYQTFHTAVNLAGA